MITTHGSILRFLLVGGSNTIVGLAVIVVAVKVIGMNDIAANAVGYTIGFIWGFALNRRWTFRHSGAPAVAFGRYALVCAVSYALNLIVLASVRAALPSAHILAQLAAVITYSVVAYLGSRYFAFTGPTVDGILKPESGTRS